jgi:DNA-binding transcriptional regulator PaaX
MKKLIVFSLVRETCKFIDFESPVSIRLTIRRLVQSRPVSPTKWRGCGHLRAHVPVRRNTISSINFQSATKISNPYYSSYCFSVKNINEINCLIRENMKTMKEQSWKLLELNEKTRSRISCWIVDKENSNCFIAQIASIARIIFLLAIH